jgi:adenylate cyclase
MPKTPPTGRCRRIGEYLGCDFSLIRSALAQQRRLAAENRTRRLGELLLEQGLVTREELTEAVFSQRGDRLAECPLFAGMMAEDLAPMRAWVSEVAVAAGDDIVTQDGTGDCFYVIVHGRAQVLRVTEHGEEIPLADIGSGECIGEMGYFAGGRRSASVRALRDCQLLKIAYDDLQTIFTINPVPARNFLNLVTERLRRTNVRFQELALRERVSEKSLQSLAKFLDLSEIVDRQTGIEGLIHQVVVMAGRVMEADRASLFIVDHFRGELWSKVAEGLGHREIRIPVGIGVAGWVAENDRFVHIPDAYADTRFDPSVDKETGFATRNILCGPVRDLSGQIIGVIQVINKKTGAFSGNDEELFKAFAYQTAIAMENFNLYRKVMRNHEKVSILLEIASAVAETIDLDTLIFKIVETVSRILKTERTTLFLVDPDTGELWSKVAEGLEVAEIRFPRGKGLAGTVVDSGCVLNIEDAYIDPRFNPAVDRVTGYRTRSVLCVPIPNREGEIIGALQTINKTEGVFDKEDEELLRAIASEIAVALENAQLHDRTVRMKNYLENIQESISNAIVVLDTEGRIQSVNRAAVELFDRQPEALCGRPMSAVLGTANRRLTALIDRLTETGRTVAEPGIEAELAGGRRHTLNASFVPLTDPEGSRLGQVLVFEDVTREKRMKGTLVRYMAKDIVDRLLEDPEGQGLGGTRSKATIAFTDIRGFTGIAESLSAEQTVAFLNDYFSRMVEVIFEYGGLLDKYIGDAIMAVFGVPYAREDDARRAVKAALSMREALGRFNKKRIAAGRAPVQAGTGICTGEVLSGNIGSERRMDFTVIGDGVNVAARLEPLTKIYGVEILVGESTWKEIRDHFATRLVDRVLVKGRKTPISIYQVLGDAGTAMTAAEQCFCRGFDLYREKNFEDAARHFSKGASEDPLCRVFFQRCRRLSQLKAAEPWDGIWREE